MTITRAELRQEIGDRIGDVLICTASDTGASASNFIDVVTLRHGNNILRGREAIMSTAADPLNTNVIRVVTGNSQATNSLDVSPPFNSPPVAGDVLELYNSDFGGTLISQIHRAINKAIRIGQLAHLIEVTEDVTDFDYTNPTYALDANWYGFIGAEWQWDEDSTWTMLPVRSLDAANRTVTLAPIRATGYDARPIRLRGYTMPSLLSSDTDSTPINAEWLIERASAELLIATNSKKTSGASSTSLAMGQNNQAQAETRRNLTRTRKKPFTRLGTS